MNLKIKAILKRIFKQILPWLIACVVLLVINSFLFQFQKIQSYDMTPNYKAGDVVLLFHTKNYDRGDVICFNFYYDDTLSKKSLPFIQRCVAKSGDSLLIENGFLYVNNKAESDEFKYSYNYHFKLIKKISNDFLEKYHLEEGGSISNENDFSYTTTESIADSIQKDSLVLEIYKNIEQPNFRDETLFIIDTIHKWNKHHFGPIYVPKKGDIIHLDSTNFFIYQKLIEKELNVRLSLKKEGIYNDKLKISNYEVLNDYYFVLGDNRDNAIDSRYLGFIKKKDGIGKIVFKFFQNNN